MNTAGSGLPGSVAEFRCCGGRCERGWLREDGVNVSHRSVGRLAVSTFSYFYLERKVSGRRAKALRKAFYQLHHRAPETSAIKQQGVLGWFKAKMTGSDSVDEKQKPVPIMATLVTDSYNEWRRFKRAGSNGDSPACFGECNFVQS